MTTTNDAVSQVVSKYANVAPGTAETLLADVGITSVKFIQVIVEIERRLGIQFAEGMVGRLASITLGDLAAAASQAESSKRTSAGAAPVRA